jgi:hypothetical protein
MLRIPISSTTFKDSGPYIAIRIAVDSYIVYNLVCNIIINLVSDIQIEVAEERDLHLLCSITLDSQGFHFMVERRNLNSKSLVMS